MYQESFDSVAPLLLASVEQANMLEPAAPIVDMSSGIPMRTRPRFGRSRKKQLRHGRNYKDPARQKMKWFLSLKTQGVLRTYQSWKMLLDMRRERFGTSFDLAVDLSF